MAISPGSNKSPLKRPSIIAILALVAAMALCATWLRRSPAHEVRPSSRREPSAAALADALVRLVRDEPFGQRWSDGSGRDSSSCQPFLGDGFRCGPVGYWVYEWTGRFSEGHLERTAYLLGDSESPTLERLSWSLPKGQETHSKIADSMWTAITQAFGRAFEQLPPSPNSVMTGGSAYWAETKLYAASRGILRIHRMARKFWIMSPASIGVEYWSTPLCAEASSGWTKRGPLFELLSDEPSTETGEIEAVTHVALGTRFPALSGALSKKPGDVGDLPAINSALGSAARSPSEEDRDLVLWAVHLWLRSLSDSTRDALASAGSLGSSIGRSWNTCRTDSVAYRLAARAGANRWTDAAFLELMRSGWGCLGGEGVDVPDTNESWVDTSAPVIEQGERYLAAHTRSPIRSEVAWRTAMAHETTWTLFKSSEPYLRSLGRAQGKSEIARGHRDRAVRLYEALISEEPARPRSQAAVKRVRRMRLDVSTDYRMYCDFLD